MNDIYNERKKMEYRLSLLILAIIDVSLVVLLILTLTRVLCGGLGCVVLFWIIIPLLVVFDILTISTGYKYSKLKKTQHQTDLVETIQQEV